MLHNCISECKNINIFGFKEPIKKQMRTEEYVSTITRTENHFYDKWSQINRLMVY